MSGYVSRFLVRKIWLFYHIAPVIIFLSPRFPSSYFSQLSRLASHPLLCLSRSRPSFNAHLELHLAGRSMTFMGLRHFCLQGLIPSFKKKNLKMYFIFLLVERNIIHTGVPSNFPLGFERNSKLLMGLLKYHGP